ncbi:MAG: 3'-5' exoribonuclease YhaM family protein, partial [bacterium]
VGEVFTGFVVVRGRELRSRKDGQPFLKLELGDRSGRVFAVIWENGEEIYHDLPEGSIIKVQGLMEQYQENRILNIRRWRKKRDDEPIPIGELLARSNQDPQKQWERLEGMLKTIRQPHLRTLIDRFLSDPEFKARFSRAPAGKLWHHNTIGGLLEHTVSLMRLVRYLGRLYPEVDRELLLVGAFLHDIGKIEELATDPIIDYTDSGRLIGHIVLGAEKVARLIATIPDFPGDQRDHLLHLILSHQGSPSQGSPVVPKTREAFLLHFADEIDSKMGAFQRLSASREDEERWKFVKLLDRHLYLGETKESDELGAPRLTS